MARGRVGGTTGYAVALVVVGMLFVVALLLAIIFSTQITDARTAQSEAQAALEKMIRSGERTDPQVAEFQADTQRSVVGHLLADTRAKSALLVGTEQTSLEAIRREIKTLEESPLGLKLGSGGLLPELSRLARNYQDAQEQVRRLEGELREAQNQAKALTSEKAELDEAYKSSVTDLSAKVEAKARSMTDYQGTVDAQRKELEGRMAALQDQYAKSSSELNAELDAARGRVRELERSLEDLKKPVAGDKLQVDPSLVPDGRVLTVINEAPLVYIDIGQSEQVILGMTFEVYDKNTGIVKDEFGTVRGKATIEVSRVQAGSSLARVVRREPKAVIVEGDVIGNVAYDPQAKLKFYVFGDFDVDNTGLATAGDRRRIEAMVSGWGGSIGDTLSYDVDFLVLGVEPKLPEPLLPNEIDPKVIEEHARSQKRFEQYQSLVGEARRFAIPILNQNRFLTMVGHYER